MRVTTSVDEFTSEANIKNVMLAGANNLAYTFLHMAVQSDIEIQAVLDLVDFNRVFYIQEVQRAVPIIHPSELNPLFCVEGGLGYQ